MKCKYCDSEDWSECMKQSESAKIYVHMHKTFDTVRICTKHFETIYFNKGNEVTNE
ncbi:hypothetical protein NVP1101O_021 [Vibrio phage 1.101.O._10N.261.45.C6]|nr:hypothetical protein NVP1101O_021 [Vibrio phage 1.101.O._10N.261.45.C6]